MKKDTTVFGVNILLLLVIIGILNGGSLQGFDLDSVLPVEDNGYVIETEVDGPDECFEMEEYDAEAGICFVECDTEEECAEIEAEIDKEMLALDDEYEEFSKEFMEFDADTGDTDDMEAEADVIYEINTGEDFVIVYGDEDSEHIKIKNWLADISPDELSNLYLGRLILVPDMEDDSAAFVIQSEYEDGKWDMFVNMKTLIEDGEKETVFTLVHEYAHILTLNESQFNRDVDDDDCGDYLIEEGCMSENAYLNVFYSKFWDGKFDEFAEDSMDNYDENPDAFVTEYAATSPEEDIAETFASFVFQGKTGSETIADQKVSLFYSYPELVSIRSSIRETLKSIVREEAIN